jgi:hypothetical protein
MLVALAIALALSAARAQAAITIELRVDAEVRRDVAVHVGAKNVGDEPAEQVLPVVTLLGTTARGDARASLPTNFIESWDLTLPRPTGLGTFPLVVVLEYADAFGHRMSVPAVHVVRTAATPPSDLHLAVETHPLATTGTATVRIENREAAPIGGSLALVTSGELAVTPSERAVEVPAGETLEVVLRVENRGAFPDSTAALWATLTLPRGSHVDTLVASGTIPIGDPSPAPSGLGVGIPIAAGAVLAAIALWAGRRWLAPTRAPRSRADRRRGR